MSTNNELSLLDIEEHIMVAWGTKEDLELIAERCNDPEVSTVLNALAVIHDFRCQKLFDMYEQLNAARTVQPATIL